MVRSAGLGRLRTSLSRRADAGPADLVRVLWPELITAILCLHLTAAIVLSWNFDYFTNLHLWQDDAIVLGRSSFGLPSGLTDLYSSVWALLAEVSIPLAKGVPVALKGLIAAATFVILRRSAWGRTASACLAVSVALLPIAADQAIFANGSHPSAGLAIALLGVAVLPGWRIDSTRRQFQTLLSVGLLILSSSVTPTLLLAPLLGIGLVAVALAELRPSRFRGAGRGILAISHLAVAAALGYRLVGLFTGSRNHYDDLPGWTDYSLPQLARGVGSLAAVGRMTALALLLLVVVAAAIALRSREDDAGHEASFRQRSLPLCALVCLAGLAAGPSLIVTNFIPRYRVVPITMLTVALLIAIAWLAGGGTPGGPGSRDRDDGRPDVRTIQGVLAGVAVVGIGLLAGGDLRSSMARADAGFLVLESAVETVDPPDGPWQMVVILPDDHRMTTGGYNHWSTWQLRVLMGSMDVIGVIASRSELRGSDPEHFWVDEYRDHGSEYWGLTASGRAFRRRVIGLEPDRPTFVFFASGEPMRAIPGGVLTDESGELRLLAAGRELGGDPSELICGSDGELLPRVTSRSSLDEFFHFDDVVMELRTTAGGIAKESVAIDESFDHVVIHDFTRTRGGPPPVVEGGYSEVWPEMPFITPDLAAYDRAEVIVALRNDDASLRVPWVEQETVELASCANGRGLVRMASGAQTFASALAISGDYTAGSGFLQRIWRQGEVRITVGRRPSSR